MSGASGDFSTAGAANPGGRALSADLDAHAFERRARRLHVFERAALEHPAVPMRAEQVHAPMR